MKLLSVTPSRLKCSPMDPRLVHSGSGSILLGEATLEPVDGWKAEEAASLRTVLFLGRNADGGAWLTELFDQRPAWTLLRRIGELSESSLSGLTCPDLILVQLDASDLAHPGVFVPSRLSAWRASVPSIALLEGSVPQRGNDEWLTGFDDCWLGQPHPSATLAYLDWLLS